MIVAPHLYTTPPPPPNAPPCLPQLLVVNTNPTRHRDKIPDIPKGTYDHLHVDPGNTEHQPREDKEEAMNLKEKNLKSKERALKTGKMP
jgi:hypothetical protein